MEGEGEETTGNEPIMSLENEKLHVRYRGHLGHLPTLRSEPQTPKKSNLVPSQQAAGPAALNLLNSKMAVSRQGGLCLTGPVLGRDAHDSMVSQE